jgi:hypothetical protein
MNVFKNLPNAISTFLFEEVAALNRQQLIETAAAYSRIPFNEGKPVVDECRKNFERNNFGTTNDFFNELLAVR